MVISVLFHFSMSTDKRITSTILYGIFKTVLPKKKRKIQKRMRRLYLSGDLSIFQQNKFFGFFSFRLWFSAVPERSICKTNVKCHPFISGLKNAQQHTQNAWRFFILWIHFPATLHHFSHDVIIQLSNEAFDWKFIFDKFEYGFDALFWLLL